MKLDLNENYRVMTDEYNFILQERRKKRKLDCIIRYKDVGYYPTLESMIRGLLNKEILKSDSNSFCDIAELIQRCTLDIVEQLKVHNVEKIKYQ